MNFIKTPTKGMRDILPCEMQLREYIINEICNIYSLFGFKRIETPCVEHIENITNNQGGENEKLIFKILKRGEKLDLNSNNIEDLVDLGLRYDLTVPLSRYYANNMNDLDNPFKAFQIGNVWRADRPQKGRFRQFVQCDIDILGEKNNLAEIELINATATLLNKIGLKDYKIVINDRRILKAMALFSGFKDEECELIFIILDKMDKIGIEGVREELLSSMYSKDIVDKYISLFTKDDYDIKSFCDQISDDYLDNEVILNLISIVDTLSNINNVNIEFDPTLVRGMSYYTGTIFEIKVSGYNGSIGGGGRYDNMISKYVNQSVPACGFSIGFERLIGILMENNYKVPSDKEKIAFIIDKNQDTSIQQELLKQATDLRNKGKIVNILYKSKNFKHQLEILEKDNYILYLNGKKYINY